MSQESSWCAIVVGVLSVSSPALAQTNDRPYETESGTFVMHKSTKNTMVTVETVDTTYFSDWGRKRATWSTATTSGRMLPKATVKRTLTILEGATITNVDLDARTGMRMQNPLAALGRMSRGQAQDMANRMAGATKTVMNAAGEATVAGQRCQVTESVTPLGAAQVVTRQCVWKNIVLKMTTNGGGSEIVEEVKTLSLGPVPAERMAVPSGIAIR